MGDAVEVAVGDHALTPSDADVGLAAAAAAARQVCAKRQFVLSRCEVQRLLGEAGCTESEFAVHLIECARQFAVEPISRFRVAAVGVSGAAGSARRPSPSL